jgi:hypothetical protein
MHTLAITLGITAYVLILTSLLSGLRIIKLQPGYHKRVGIAAAIAASFHLLIMIYFMYFA